jgi:hypothetical protein
LGLYQLTEAIKIDVNRVAITEIKRDNPGGGYILEIDNFYQSEQFLITTNIKGIVFSCSDPDEGLDEVAIGDTKTLLEIMTESVQQAEDVLYSDGFMDPENGYRKYFDIESFVDFCLASEITYDHEIANLSGKYIYYDPSVQKYCMGPLWDFDGAFQDHGNPWGGTYDGFLVKDFEGWWINRMFEDPYFVLAVKARWNEKKAEFDFLIPYIAERVIDLDRAKDLNYQRWNSLLGNSTHQQEIANMTSWLIARLAWLDTAINSL